MKILISLIGDQPAPNVLPLRHYAPDKVVLVHTKRTEALAGRIANVIRNSFAVQEPFCKTDPYLIQDIRVKLKEYLVEYGLDGEGLIFNLTGGTKTMEYAALELARQCNARAFYYQTEDNKSLVHPYHFENGVLAAEEPFPLSQVLILGDYLGMYVGKFEPTNRFNDHFEQNVYEVLKSTEELPKFEVFPPTRLTGVNSTVEVDAIVRLGNQVAVLEVKRRAGKGGIDQLNSATHPLMLGTYTRKVIVTSAPLDGNNADLAEAYKIQVILLESGSGNALSEDDKVKLVTGIKSALEPRS